MVIDRRPFVNLYTITETSQPFDDSSSSSQQQVSLYTYSLSNPRLFSQPTTGSRTYLSGAVATAGMRNGKSNLGQTQFQIDAGASLEYQRIRSNDALYHISQMLMEDSDERVDLHQGEAALQAAEKPFYDILEQVYPPSLNRLPLHSANEPDIPDENTSSNNYHNRQHTSHSSYTMLQPLLTPLSSYSYRRSLFLPNQQAVSTAWTSRFDIPSLQTRRGVEGANRFIPSIDKLVINLDSDRLSISKMTTKAKVGDKSKYAAFKVTDQRDNPYIMDLDILEGRNSKRYAIYYCEIIRNEMFDKVLLCYGVKNFAEASHLRETMAKEASKNSLNGQTKGSARRKLRYKKQLQKDVVDLRSLLIHCAQAVAADDRLLASELVKKIRHHSSADGDSNQRLAFYLVDGLEARLAGIGSQMYHKLMARRTSTENMLKAYSLKLSACPFDRASFAFSNHTILDASKGQQPRKVHIVDFGICTGFQWPSLIQRFANEEGGPPKLRITGIDMPQPGFHPCEIIEETGKRLADYANLFNVPFQYQGIASRWETIQIEDLNIDKDEVLIINCMFRMKNLGDEMVAMNSARDRVLKTIKMMNPRVFILGIVNGSYSSPFFITRFKEVLFHYSSLFDMIDANVPRDNEARKMIERGLFGKDALNIIACEGAERTERPESYKQWQARCLKAGFKQLPVDPATLKEIVNMKKGIYHEDFVADEDSGWLLQGWKGRVIYAISTWA